MKTYLLVSVVSAVAGGTLGAQMVDRIGDPERNLSQFEETLDAAFQERVLIPSDEATVSLAKRYLINDPDGRTLEVQSDSMPDETQLSALFALSAGNGPSRSGLPKSLQRAVGEVRHISPGWSELTHLCGVPSPWRISELHRDARHCGMRLSRVH